MVAAVRARSSNCSSVILLSLVGCTGHAPAMPNDKVPSRMRFTLIAAAAAAAALIPSPALAWGKTGHRVVAAIADTPPVEAGPLLAFLVGPDSRSEAAFDVHQAALRDHLLRTLCEAGPAGDAVPVGLLPALA